MASRLLAARCARYRDEGHSKPLWLGLDGHPGRAKRPVQRVSETADGEHCGEQVSGKAFQDNSAARTRSIIAREAERGTAANEHTSVGCSCSQLRLLQSVFWCKSSENDAYYVSQVSNTCVSQASCAQGESKRRQQTSVSLPSVVRAGVYTPPPGHRPCHDHPKVTRGPVWEHTERVILVEEGVPVVEQKLQWLVCARAHLAVDALIHVVVWH